MRTVEAINLFEGNASRLARELKISRQAVYQWGEYVPERRALQIKYEILPRRFDAPRPTELRA